MPDRNSSTPLYGIAVAADLLGIPEASLRLFESKGLLTPSRTQGGTRRYSDDDLVRLRRIAELREQGLNLEGVLRVLELQDENQALRDELAG
ncbi:MerR family transcriptional regulator [Microbacterium sp. LWH3-1.2]|jgi:DNA-binding transcriptional MerR regulator|uniref:MerR family transcriptional regulator n=1 Tax=Microbacterium sp. LWH3-1.2 TaxID=3135256 RepID=UPI00343C9011